MGTSEKRLSAALNARIIGSGIETIVFAHGFGADQSFWDKILPPLAESYRLVLFDWPFSVAVKDQSLYDPIRHSSYEAIAQDLITLMEEMDLKAATFVGHSMSGMLGCIAAINRPELFKRLILVGASPRFLNTDDYEGGFRSSDIEQILSSIESDFPGWASSFASLIVGPNDAASVDKYRKCLLRMRPELALSLAKTVFSSDHRDLLDKVDTPCTIIQTTNDNAVPHSVALYMEKKIKGKCTVEIIDNDGHFPQLTAHLKLVEVLTRVMGYGYN